MNEERRPDGQIGAAQSDAAGNHKPNLTVGAGTDRAWTWTEVVHLHRLGVSLIPLRGKTPLVRWRRGRVDYVHQQPTLAELERWARLGPDAWAITGGGPAAWVGLDAEAAGVMDEGHQGQVIRAVLRELPASCRRPSPSGGAHAWLKVIDGPVPPAPGAKLALRTEAAGDPTLLAELRTEGQYAVILGPGRGPLPPDFAPLPLTVRELDHLLGRIRAVSDKPQPLRASRPSAPDELEADPETWLSRLTPQEPCQTVISQAGSVAKQLATDRLTPAILGPVLQLVRLAHSGHTGVPKALESIREDFFSRAAVRGPQRASDAATQWEASIWGAVREVGVPSWLLEGRPRVCVCWLDSFMGAYDAAPAEHRSRNSRARTYDRQILEHLVHKAKLNRSQTIREAQRQIAEATDISTNTVSKALSRLEHLGWVTQKGHPRSITTIRLVQPASTTTTTELSTAVGSSVVVVPAHGVHRLFGPAGFRPGVAETFARLPEWRQTLRGRPGHLVRVTPGSGAAGGGSSSGRGIPAAPGGQGLTVAELVSLTGKAPSTVRTHLRKLETDRAAFRDREGRWWRYLFEPNWLADLLGIPDTALARKQLHDRQRRLHYRYRVIEATSAKAHVDDGFVYYTEVVNKLDTGAILWIDFEPEDTSWIQVND